MAMHGLMHPRPHIEGDRAIWAWYLEDEANVRYVPDFRPLAH